MIKGVKFKDWRLMSQRQRMSPFPNYMSMEAMTKLSKKYVGEKLDWVMLIFEDRIMNGFTPSKSFFRSADNIVGKVVKDPNLYGKMVDWQNYWGRRLVKYTKLVAKHVNSKTTNQQLFKFWQGYEKIYHEVYACYGSVWIIEDIFNSRLMAIVNKRISSASKSVRILNSLTLEPRAMVARVERQALLKIAVIINKKARWRSQILKSNIDKFDKALFKLILQHEKKYFWLTRDYEDPILDKAKIIENLKKALKNNPEKSYKAMVAELNTWKQSGINLSKKLKLSASEKKQFSAMHDVAYLKELRKRYVSESLYYFDKVLLEIAKRSYLTLKQVRFLFTADVKKILINKVDYSEVINERIKLSVWVSTKGQTQVVTGKQAQGIKDKFITPHKNVKEFIGTPVSPGIARGRVKVVLDPSECNKVKKGDIIVSIQVVPSFSAAIQRSAGLICDGGHGITTHPAILAREAKIPAIIQTRFAREILKDGDWVEVDGYTGVAKKLAK